MSHTPGPWEKVEFANSDGWVRGQFLHQGRAALGFYHDGSPEGYANSSLATAAPELMAALQWARGHILRYTSVTKKQDGTDETLARIDAALARAKGE